jgi:hypothetical protein
MSLLSLSLSISVKWKHRFNIKCQLIFFFVFEDRKKERKKKKEKSSVHNFFSGHCRELSFEYFLSVCGELSVLLGTTLITALQPYVLPTVSAEPSTTEHNNTERHQ